MNKSKFLEYFDATEVCKKPVHIVGCGSIGSNVAEQLVRMGVEKFHLWDFDKVESHNIANQMFFHHQIGMSKVDAVEEIMLDINPQIQITKHPEGCKENEIMNGYIFLCVDKIDLRRSLINANKMNPNCKCFHDFRTRLTDAQYYFADRSNPEQVEALLQSMDFTSEEATEATPMSACGVTLSVEYTVKSIVCRGIANHVAYCLEQPVKTMMLDNFNLQCVDSFPMQ